MEPDTELLDYKYPLKITAEWEQLIYHRRGKEIKSKSFDKVRIKDELFSVSWRLEMRWYDDHGHNYSTATWVGYIEDSFGVPVSLEHVLKFQKIYIK